MKQVIRLMDMPDKVIAFDELPSDLLKDLDMIDCSKLPRHWRDFIGYRERVVNIKPERDPFTGQMRTFTPVVEKAPFAWIVDREVNKDKEAWRAIESYVKRNAPKDFRLTDPIVDIETGRSTMALKMAADAQSELSLEPEDVIVVPLGVDRELEGSSSVVKVYTEEKRREKEETTVKSEEITPTVKVEINEPKIIRENDYQCDICNKYFINSVGVMVHKRRIHKIEVKKADIIASTI